MSETYTANLRRGALLLDRCRYEDAMPFFQQALASDPMDAYVLAQLAVCQSHIHGQQTLALDSINAAIGSEPDNAIHYGMKAMILCQLNHNVDALLAAEQGIALEPDHPFPRAAQAQAFLGRKLWADAERAARAALALDPDHDLASNQLVQALYEQHQHGENRERVLALLADQPEDPHVHYNAGYSYLQSGDHRKSLEHFCECLRLDPLFQAARIGVLEALRARYSIYRWYLKVHFAVDAWSKRFKFSNWLLPLAVPLIIVSSLLHAIATFLLMFDRRARMTMDVDDKINGILGGGGILLGLALLLCGVVSGSIFLLKLSATIGAATLMIAWNLSQEIPDRLRM
ncbi:MAG: tetratricopeptide (TPR) repeat protein [Verrucomicrobiales bacterium]